VNAFKQWTASLARPEIVAGDFNDVPGSAFDYIFSAGALTTESATILPAKISDHRAVVATFRMNGRS
jgi:endonuclease/exonuclease/phosphatase (EEP) superfamily protein YafD